MSKKAAVLGRPALAEIQSTGMSDVDINKVMVVSNFRRHFDEKHLKELADNIAKHSVLVPILVREMENGELHLIAGERRLRASKLAGLKRIPARLFKVTDQQAAEIQALENLHRKDLGPIEEAQAFKTLLDQGNYDVKALADRMDKSEAYIYRAVALLELPAKVVKEIEKGELTASHGHQILRLPTEKRDEAVKFCLREDWDSRDFPTAKRLRNWVDENLGSDLSSARFTKDKPFAGEVACNTCPFNSGNQGMLFDGAEKGRCLKKSCYDKKQTQVRADEEVLYREKYGEKFKTVTGSLYDGSRMDGGIVIGKIGDKKTAASLKKEGRVVMDQRGDIFVVSADKEEIKKNLGYIPGSSSSGSGNETAQQRFIRTETETSILDAIAKAAQKIEKRHWVEINRQLHNASVPKHILSTAGVDWSGSSYGNGFRKALESLSIEKLEVLAVQMAVWSSTRGFYETGWREDKLRAIGVDASKVVKDAKAAAKKAWDDKKAKPDAKAKARK